MNFWRKPDWVELLFILAAGSLVGLALLVPRTRPVVRERMAPAGDYESVREAAVAALSKVYEDLPYYEVGGVIVQLPTSRYVLSLPHTDFRGDAVELNLDPDAYRGVIVATWHTHPCLYNTHTVASFSGADIAADRAYHLLGYMGDGCTGKVYEYDERFDVRPPDQGVLAGRMIGQYPVSGQILDAGLPGAPVKVLPK